jgi:glycosyltransferase involved in cell wall biosynthesis
LPATLAGLPRTLPGIDTIEYLVIDDGRRTGRPEVATAHGVHHVIRFNRHRGLAAAFAAGIDAASDWSADVIVNTDADNQYPGQQIGS